MTQFPRPGKDIEKYAAYGNASVHSMLKLLLLGFWLILLTEATKGASVDDITLRIN